MTANDMLSILISGSVTITVLVASAVFSGVNHEIP